MTILNHELFVKAPDDILQELADRSGPDPPAPLLRLLGLASRELTARLGERLAAAGFADQRLAHNAVFANVPPEGIRLTDLADRAGMTKQAMSELVNDLERLGYLRRRPDPTDGRARLIEFSDRGWAAVHAALTAFEDMEAELGTRVGVAKVRQLRRTLEVIAHG
jgi:DNA-binding MarR family transcriptional regulator